MTNDTKIGYVDSFAERTSKGTEKKQAYYTGSHGIICSNIKVNAQMNILPSKVFKKFQSFLSGSVEKCPAN